MSAKTPAKDTTAKGEDQQTPACRVRAAGASVRVAGHRFGAEPTAFAAGELSDEQYATLAADPRVVMLPPEAPAAADAG